MVDRNTDFALHDVFISYRFEQQIRYFVDAMEHQFDQANPTITYWRDRRNITPGMGWEKAIDDALHACRIVVVIITPGATASQYVNYEWCYALGLGKEIVPILYDDTSLHVKLQTFQHIDFTSRRAEKPPWDELIVRIQKVKQSPVVQKQAVTTGDRIEAEIRRLIEDTPSDEPLGLESMIDFLMRERILNHAQVHRIQDLLRQR